jgi:hypothetical protein
MSYTKPLIQSKLFALGSILYKIETTNKPYFNKNDKELEKLFKADKYLNTGKLILGKVIINCWIA